ncbi:MAG: glycosyltransferase, partial [Candidatus Baldrarchaeia archaeon]
MNDKPPLLSIIIPTYNERDNIPKLLARIHSVLHTIDYEVIIVDDNSPDRTWEVAEKLSSIYPVRVLRRINKRGLGSAVVDGFKIARGKVLGVMDADLQHPPEKILELLS